MSKYLEEQINKHGKVTKASVSLKDLQGAFDFEDGYKIGFSIVGCPDLVEDVQRLNDER